jgi:hypothetical protein
LGQEIQGGAKDKDLRNLELRKLFYGSAEDSEDTDAAVHSLPLLQCRGTFQTPQMMSKFIFKDITLEITERFQHNLFGDHPKTTTGWTLGYSVPVAD